MLAVPTQPLQIPYADIVALTINSSGTITIEELIRFLEDEWHTTYYDMSRHNPCVLKFSDQGFTFLFDQASANTNDVDDRLVVAYGFSAANGYKRDKSRISGLLGGGIDIPGKGKFDKGHALAHAMGGGLDVNLFPQNSELNRGKSDAGKVYRKMEQFAADHPGTFVFSRLLYGDDSWVPSSLEYGVLRDEGLWVEWFENIGQ